MYRPNVGKVLKHLALFTLIFIVYVLQSTVFVHLPILGQKPLLLPLTVAAIILNESGETAAIYGLIAGLFCDISMDQPTVIFTFSLTLIGAVGGWVSQRYLEKGLLPSLLLGAGVLLLCGAIQSFPLLMYRHAGLLDLTATALVQTVYSLPFLVPINLLCRLISRIPDTIQRKWS